MFIFNDIHPSSEDGKFGFQGNVAGGADYNETITSTFFFSYHNEGDTAAAVAYQAASDQAQGTAFQPLSDNIGLDNDQSGSGFLHLYSPSSTTFVKMFYGRGNSIIESDQTYDNLVAGYFNTTTAITRVQFKMSSDAIDAGTIKLYGVN